MESASKKSTRKRDRADHGHCVILYIYSQMYTFWVNYFLDRISALGGLRVPKIPDEFDAFKGPKLHSAKWDKTIQLKNKKVAIVGTGGEQMRTFC